MKSSTNGVPINAFDSHLTGHMYNRDRDVNHTLASAASICSLQILRNRPRVPSHPPTLHKTDHGLGREAGGSRTTIGSPTLLANSDGAQCIRSVQRMFRVLLKFKSAIESFERSHHLKISGRARTNSPPAIARSSTRPRRSIYTQL